MRGENAGPLTFYAGEALAQFRRVKIKSGTTTNPPEVEYADLNDRSVGMTCAAAASGELVAVKTMTAPGNRVVTAAGAFAVGATVYGANDGKVDDVSTSAALLGTALEAAAADGDLVEIVPIGTEIPA